MDLKLSGKAAIVTGASQGLGKAIALELAREGVRTFVVARNAQNLADTAATAQREFGAASFAHAADLSQPQAAIDCVAAAVQALGGVDILVNCAGATKRGDFFALTDADWTDGYALKFHGAVRMARAAWPHIEAAKGSIINIAGIGSRTPTEDFTIGGSVNSALLNFTKALADLGRQRGVRVNAINPGHIISERMEHRVRVGMEKTGLSREAVMESQRQELRVVRFGLPEEIGQLVAFLASPVSDYIQGTTIDIDGGATKGL
jgi:NAD(P)-dependent dehydrogenase (short-subunit alcohol dehydrogenase family)